MNTLPVINFYSAGVAQSSKTWTWTQTYSSLL